MYGIGQDLSLASAIYLLMFTVHGLLQQEFILEHLIKLNPNLRSVSSIFSDSPENPHGKKKVSPSKLALKSWDAQIECKYLVIFTVIVFYQSQEYMYWMLTSNQESILISDRILT